MSANVLTVAAHHVHLAARIDRRPRWLRWWPPSATQRTVLQRCRALASLLAARPGVLAAEVRVAHPPVVDTTEDAPDVTVHLALADADAVAQLQAHPAFVALVHRLREHAQAFEARITPNTHRPPHAPRVARAGDTA